MVPSPSRHKDPITIADAYAQLSQEAFAVWMRLHVCTPEELDGGRQNLAKLLGLSNGRSNEVLRELVAKRFVQMNRAERNGLPTQTVLVKRALLVGRDAIIKLSNVLSGGLASSEDWALASSENPLEGSIEIESGGLSNVLTRGRNPGVHRVKFITEDSTEGPSLHGTAVGGSHEIATSNNSENQQTTESQQTPELEGDQRVTVKDNGRLTFVPEDLPESENQPPPGKVPPNLPAYTTYRVKGVDLEKLKSERSKSKEQRRSRLKPKNVVLAAEAHVDFARLLGGTPVEGVSFTPSPAQREAVLAALSKPKSDPTRVVIEDKLGKEFQRVYARYRR